jgi:hypothetical protein
MITLSSDDIKRLSLYIYYLRKPPFFSEDIGRGKQDWRKFGKDKLKNSEGWNYNDDW